MGVLKYLNVSTNLIENINYIKNELKNSSDLMIQYINLGQIKISIVFIQGLVNKETLNCLSVELTEYISSKNSSCKNTTEDFDILKTYLTNTRSVKEESSFDSLLKYLLSGYTVVLAEGKNNYVAINTYGVEGRAITEPTAQTIVRGPKEGFTEDKGINISLIRKRIKNKALKVEEFTAGSITNTNISIMYIENIAKEEIIGEIKKRLNKIRIDSILDSSYIEELIKDDRYSIFPTFLNSEKPDSVVAALLEGRVAILVENTPFVLTAPALFFEFFQTSEDYYHNFIISSLTRILRYGTFLLTLLVPSMYIAFLSFNQEIIPTPLLISIASQREGVPFPVLIETLLMEITFEILREAGIRMPRVIGPSISIVGALVLGQAAVEAGIISAAVVIVVSITAIASFTIPNYSMSNAVRVIRFCLMILAGTMGLYGIFMGLIAMILHLCKLKSIGIPYLTPIAPKIKGGFRDTLVRYPLWKMNSNSAGIRNVDIPRADNYNPVDSDQKENPEFR